MSKVKELLGALDAVTSEHVAELDEEIAAKQADLAKLQHLRKIVTGGGGPRKKREPGAGPRPQARAADEGRGDSGRRLSVARLLAKEGSMHSQVICNRLGFALQGFAKTMDHPWFELTSRGYELTGVGKKAVEQAT